jgi:hypothetical protein
MGLKPPGTPLLTLLIQQGPGQGARANQDKGTNKYKSCSARVAGKYVNSDHQIVSFKGAMISTT